MLLIPIIAIGLLVIVIVGFVHNSASGRPNIQNAAVAITSWIWLDGDLTNLVSSGLSTQILQYFFNNPNTYILQRSQGADSEILSTLPNAKIVQIFDTQAELTSAVTNHTLYPNVSYVGLDAQFWATYRASKQQDLIQLLQGDETLAHQHGLKFFLAIPAIVAPQLAVVQSGNKFTDYENENLAGQGAAISDVFEIETQELQNNTVSFDALATTTIAQARAGNSNIPIILGLTTVLVSKGTTYSEQSMMDAYTSTKALAGGYWINGAGTAPAVAVSFLQNLYATQHTP